MASVFFPLGASLKEHPGLVPLDPEVCVPALRGPRTWSWVTVHLGWASCHFGNQQSRQDAERRLRGTPFGWDLCLPPPHLPSGHWQVFRGTSGSQPSKLSRWCSRRGLHVCGREWFLFLISCLTHWKFGQRRVKSVCLGQRPSFRSPPVLAQSACSFLALSQGAV